MMNADPRSEQIIANEGLIYKTVGSFAAQYPFLPFDDLINEGRIAFAAAIEAHDPNRPIHAKVSTLAVRCICNRLANYAVNWMRWKLQSSDRASA